jgi:hypothetical protein
MECDSEYVRQNFIDVVKENIMPLNNIDSDKIAMIWEEQRKFNDFTMGRCGEAFIDDQLVQATINDCGLFALGGKNDDNEYLKLDLLDHWSGRN